MDEMENNAFTPRVHIVYLKCMLVFAAATAAAFAPTNHVLHKTSPGTVSFFVDHLYAKFSFTK